jgi:ribosomal protein S18 acetylase RimI-like enzyme
LVETLSSAERATIEQIWRERWGLPICTPTGNWMPEDVQGLVLRRADEKLLGLVTFRIDGPSAEIITLNVLEDSRSGHGTSLLKSAEAAARRLGATRAFLFTSNDNLRAVGFYQKRGFRLVRVHLDAVTASRRVKPSIPTVGEGGIPLLDSWELCKELSAD